VKIKLIIAILMSTIMVASTANAVTPTPKTTAKATPKPTATKKVTKKPVVKKKKKVVKKTSYSPVFLFHCD